MTGERFRVDARRCIRCAACSTLAPALFSLRSGDVAVVRQPQADDERLLAHAALINCPASAIGVRDE